jgi:lysophospholipase L1-like esterase
MIRPDSAELTCRNLFRTSYLHELHKKSVFRVIDYSFHEGTIRLSKSGNESHDTDPINRQRRKRMHLACRLDTLRAKAAAGDPVTVAFLGGSITCGYIGDEQCQDNSADCRSAECYDPEIHSWRARTFRWLTEHLQSTPGQFRQINASIGGTGSLMGAIRVKEDVMAYHPDLVFIEFAVNDNWAARLTESCPHDRFSIFASLGSIVAQLREADPGMAIFMPISSCRRSPSPEFAVWMENMRLAAQLTEDFCRRNGIPYLDIHDAFYGQPDGLVRTGALFCGEDTAGNAVHPSPYGHQVYADAVCKVLAECLDGAEKEKSDPISAGEMAKTSGTGLFPHNTSLLMPEAFAESCEGAVLRDMASNRLEAILSRRRVLQSEDEGRSLVFEFYGSMAGAWFDPACRCSLTIRLDGRTAGRWLYDGNAFRGDFGSLDVAVFGAGLDPATRHRLEIVPDIGWAKANGYRYRLSIRNIFIDDYKEL